jgi:hypothetical protein
MMDRHLIGSQTEVLQQKFYKPGADLEVTKAAFGVMRKS